MKTIYLLCFLSVFFSGLTAQVAKNTVSVGLGILVPAHMHQSNKAVGYGAEVKGQHFFSPRVAGLLSIGYTYFGGELTYWNEETDNHFALIPLLIGARYYFKSAYAGFEAGPAIAASRNASTKLAVAPSLGVVKNRFDLGAVYFSVPFRGGIPEGTFLQKGGYSYIGLRIAYRL